MLNLLSVVAALVLALILIIRRMPPKVERVVPLGLDEEAGTYASTVPWAPSPDAQYRANIWAMVQQYMRGAPRRERRAAFWTLLRADFKHRSAQVTDETRRERRRIMHAR